MFSKLTLASLALSAVAAADSVLDTTMISKWPYFKENTANTGLTEIKKESQKLLGLDYAAGAVAGTYGCAQCIMMGLELWIAQTSAAGDQWNTNVDAAEVAKQNCCLPGYKLDKANSCDPAGTIQATLRSGALLAAYDWDSNSSRTWGTPEVSILLCPNDKAICGASKLVTLVSGTASTLQFGAKTSGTALTKAKSNCSWLVKSACKPITIAYDAASSKAVSAIADEFEVQWIQLPADKVASDRVGTFKFTKDQILATAAVGSTMYDMTQLFSSGQTTAAFQRMLPISVVELWVKQYNAAVKAYSDSLPAYEAAVKNFNLVHAPAASLKADKDHATKLADYIKTLPKMKTTTGTESTLPLLPERPSFTVERPLAWAGPTQIKEADSDRAAVNQFYPAMGSGKLLTGMLTLAADKVQGYGTKGEDAKAKVVNYSVDAIAKGETDTSKCTATYLGVIARAKADGTAALGLTVEEGTWYYPELAVTNVPALPTPPLVREAAQYLAAGAASIALVAASLY